MHSNTSATNIKKNNKPQLNDYSAPPGLWHLMFTSLKLHSADPVDFNFTDKLFTILKALIYCNYLYLR